MMESNIEEFNELSRDLFANFGMAYFSSECLHRELCNFYVLKFSIESPGMTRPRSEELYVTAESMTLGKIIDELKLKVEPRLADEFDKANLRRNYLAHHFWFKTAPLMFDREGVIQATNELREHQKYFSKLDEEISIISRKMSRSIGVTDKILEDSMSDLISGKSDEIRKPIRNLKKIEKIISVYDVSVTNLGNSFVFESEDGTLWQLCDVGLGWSAYDKKEDNWKPNPQFSFYLPFNINTRPKKFEKWKYEFEIGKGARFWVNKENEKSPFKWGIRKKRAV